MTVQRFIVCDGPGCDMGVSISHEAPLRDLLPENWCGFIVYPSALDHHFCSFECLANFANAEVALHNEDAARNAEANSHAGEDPLGEAFMEKLEQIAAQRASDEYEYDGTPNPNQKARRQAERRRKTQ